MKRFFLYFLVLLISIPFFSHSMPWLIIANGPHLSIHELTSHFQNHRVLALDGAANHLQTLSLFPHVILGDFDSIEEPAYWGIVDTFKTIDENSQPYQGSFEVSIVPAKDQNYTDLEKAIIYCDHIESESILVLQAVGGRMDHTLGNLGLLRKYYQQKRMITIQTEMEQIFFLKDAKVIVSHGEGGTCAIMAYPEAFMTTSGLAYNGIEYPLVIGIQESICNTILESPAELSIKGEALIILPKSATFILEDY